MKTTEESITELLDEHDGCKIKFYVNTDFSGLEGPPDEDDLSFDELPVVNYIIKNGKLLTLDSEELFDIKDIIDEDKYSKRIFDIRDLIREIIHAVDEKKLYGYDAFNLFYENEWFLFLEVEDKDGRIFYEEDDYQI